jgi:DNA-binding LacI/PurR family transcriptional regulator
MGLKTKDIAAALHISPATVSLVLNNKPGVGKQTRERIFKYISDSGYDAGVLSKPLLEGKRNIRFIVYKKHGMVVSDTPFFSQLIEGIEQESRRSGYNLLISYIDETAENNSALRIVSENLPDGILILATEMATEDIIKFCDLAAPVVALDRPFKGLAIDTVVIDNVQGAREAVTYLIEMGHARIGYLHSSVEISNFMQRCEGFAGALRDHGLAVGEDSVLSLVSTFDGAYSDMQAFLQSGRELAEAYFADNDIIALGAVKAMNEAGIRVPEDVSVVGFDDIPMAAMTDLSTVGVFKQRLGMIAVKRLIERINNPLEEYVNIEVGTRLIFRKSVSDKRP